MKIHTLSFLIFLLFLSQSFIYGQNASSIADSIDQRMSNLINSSNSFQEYKVIKTTGIQSLRRDIKSEVSSLEENMKELHTDLASQKEELENFKELLAASDAKLEEANTTKDQLSILGVTTQKSTYNFFVSVVILGLVIALLFFIYRFKNGNRIAIEARENLQKNEEEFAAYKKKALETQQKLGRQIIDERKKAAMHV